MVDDISIDIDTAALEKALTALPARVAGRYMREALQAAGDLMLVAMKTHAPVRTDEGMPDSTSLPPGILREDLTTQIQAGTKYPPRVKVGPTSIAGHVARWQENGWTLTGHGKSRGGRKKIKAIPGKHFMAASADESADRAVTVLVERLASALGHESVDESSGPLQDYGGEGY